MPGRHSALVHANERPLRGVRAVSTLGRPWRCRRLWRQTSCPFGRLAATAAREPVRVAGVARGRVGARAIRWGAAACTGARHRRTRRSPQERSRSSSRAALGTAVEVDPLEAQLLSVHLAYGAVQYWRLKLSREQADDTEPIDTVAGFTRAVAELNRFSKVAIDAGIAERLVNIAESAGEQIAQVCEGALVAAGVVLTVEQRARYAGAIELGLTRDRGWADGRGAISRLSDAERCPWPPQTHAVRATRTTSPAEVPCGGIPNGRSPRGGSRLPIPHAIGSRHGRQPAAGGVRLTGSLLAGASNCVANQERSKS